MKPLELAWIAVALIAAPMPGPAQAEESPVMELSPVVFEEALPDEPGRMTLRWVGDLERAREAGDASLSRNRAQWFFGIADGVSGEIELPLLRLRDPNRTTWGVGRAGLALKVGPGRSAGWPLALRAEVELPTASSALPEEVRQSTGALLLAGAVGERRWGLQADLGYETTWDASDRSWVFDIAGIRRLSNRAALHAELAGECPLGGGPAQTLAGPGLSLGTSYGLRLGGAALFGLTSESERARVVVSLGREF